MDLDGILLSAMADIRSKMHFAMQHILSQLVFSSDVILNIIQQAKWSKISQRKQAIIINKGNQKENGYRQLHVYCTGDIALFKNIWKIKFNQHRYIYLYSVTEGKNNKIIHTHKPRNTSTSYYLHNITPYQGVRLLSIMGEYVIGRCKS